MEKKTCIVTGASSGIGYATALILAEQGHQVGVICRSKDKADEVANNIRKESGNSEVTPFVADLSSQKQLKAVADQITKKFPRLDILVNNAGTWFSKRTLTEDGLEMMFAVNHLAYFLLTHLLIPNLEQSNDARVVNVGSDSHFSGKIHFNDVMLERKYHGLRAYNQSKLANTMFTYEFARRCPYPQIKIHCLQPGLVKTPIGNKNTNGLHSLAWTLRVKLWKSVDPRQGAATSVYCATHEEAGKQSGLYWDKCKPKPSSELSYVKEDCKKLWEMSEKLCSIDDYFATAPEGAITSSVND